MKFFKILFTFLCTTFLLLGCASEKRQRADAIQFYQKHPEEFVIACNDKFPTPAVQYIQGNTVYQIDTVIVPGDTIPCQTINQQTGDTIWLPTIVVPKSKIIREGKSRVDTVYRTDPKEIKIQEDKLKKSEFEYAQLLVKLEFTEVERNRYKTNSENQQIFIGAIILLIILYIYLRVKRVIPF